MPAVQQAAPRASEDRIPRRALILLVLLTLIWGTNWALFPIALREISVWTFRAVGLPVSGLAMLAIAHVRGMPLQVPRADRSRLLAMTVAYMLVWNIASTYAAILIPSGQGAVLGFTMPLWAAVISRVLFGEKLSRRLIVALLLGVLAIGLMMAPGYAAYAHAPWGLAAGLLAAIAWAIGTLIIKRHQWSTPALVLTGWQMLLTALPITAGALVLGDHQLFMPTWQTMLVGAYIVLIPMSIGSVSWFAIVGLLPPNVAGLSVVIVPVVAMITGALLHGEPLGPLQVLALLLCIGALSLTLLKPATQPP